MDDILKYNKSDSNEDYYQILGCDQSSSKEQIISEYKNRALVVHPDKQQDCKESEELFKRLVKARDVLTDPEMKKSYDKWKGSGIAVTFDKWLQLGKGVHVSMHWINKCNKDLMLESGQTQQPLRREPKHLSNLWSSDSDNEMLIKFRNYKI